MAQHRDLHPLTVYLPKEVIEFYNSRATEHFEPVSAALRRVILSDYWQLTEKEVTR